MRVYLDNAATTQMLPEVRDAMLPYFCELYGNPGGFHSFSREAQRAVDRARRTVAACLNASPGEIVFTGGGSEGDNTALRGAVRAYREKGNHVITSAIEHHAVLRTLEAMEAAGEATVTVLPVDGDGVVNAEQVRAAIRSDTALVSVMLANNEIGTIEPIAAIGTVCREAGVLLHTDAVQAVGQIPVDVKALNVDLLTLTAHKFHGPKGAGALYVRKGVRLAPLITGGEQETKRRAGTENVPGIVGLSSALKIATDRLSENAAHMTRLRDRLIAGIGQRIPAARLNGPRTDRLPNNVNFTFDGVRSEGLLMRLDLCGIAASSGSACTAGSLDPSHVLLALGASPREAKSALRLTLSSLTTETEIDYALGVLPDAVRALTK